MLQMMSWKRLLLGLALVLLLLAGGLMAWLWNTDLGRFKDTLQSQVLARTGADLRFAQLSILLGPELSVSGSGLTLDNPGWPGDRRVLSVERFALTLDLSSLWDDGPIQVFDADISGAHADLRQDEQGRGNYQFGEPSEDGEDDAPGVPLVVHRGRLETGTVTWEDPDRTAPIRIEVESLDLARDAEDWIQLDLAGAVNDQAARYSGQVGPFQSLVTGGQIGFDGQGRFGTLALEGQGTIDRLTAPNRPELDLTVSGPDIRDVERMLGLAPDKAGAYRLNLQSGSRDEDWTVSLAGRIGALEIALDGTADGLRSAERFDLAIEGSGPDLGGPLRLFGLSDAPREPFDIKGRLRREGSRLDAEDILLNIGETALSLEAGITRFPGLQDSRITLDVRGPDMAAFRALLDLPGVAEGPFALHLDLEPVLDDFDRLKATVTTQLGRLELAGRISEEERYAGSEATVRLDSDNGGRALEALGAPGFAEAPLSLESVISIGEDRVRLTDTRLEGVMAATLEASGEVGFEPLGPATRLEIRVSGADLANSLDQRGLEWPMASGAFDLSSTVAPDDVGLRFTGLEGTVGHTRLKADARIPFNEELVGLSLDLEAQGTSLDSLLGDLTPPVVPDKDWTLSLQAARKADRLELGALDARLGEVTAVGNIDMPWPIEGDEGSFRLLVRGPDLSRVAEQLAGFELAANPFELSLDGGVSGGAWRFEPSWLEVHETRLQLSGTVDRLPDFSDTDLELTLRSPDVGALGRWDGYDLPHEPVSLDLHLAGGTTDLWLDGMRLVAGESEVDGNLRWDRAGEVPRLTLDLASKRVDLRPWLPAPAPDPAQSPASNSGDGRLIPDVPLPLDVLAALDADLKIEVGEIETHRRIMTDVEVDGRLENGALIVDRYHTRGLAGDLTATASLSPTGGGQAEMRLEFQTLGLVPVRESWRNADPASLPRIDAHAGLRAKGADLRGLAASLSGDVQIVSSEGTLPGRGLGALNLGLLQQLVTVLIPGYSLDRPTELRCFATRLKANNGLLTTEPIIALSTDRVLILGSGTVNLANETLDLGFQTTPTKLLGLNFAELVNPFVRIRGTMAEPRPEVDPTGTLIYGGAAWATAGLSIVAKGLWDRIRGSTKPCEGLREELRAGARASAPPS